MPGQRLRIHARAPRGLKGGREPLVTGAWHLGVGAHVHPHAVPIHSWSCILLRHIVGIYVWHVMLSWGVGVAHGVVGGLHWWLMSILLLIVESLSCIMTMTLHRHCMWSDLCSIAADDQQKGSGEQ